MRLLPNLAPRQLAGDEKFHAEVGDADKGRGSYADRSGEAGFRAKVICPRIQRVRANWRCWSGIQGCTLAKQAYTAICHRAVWQERRRR